MASAEATPARRVRKHRSPKREVILDAAERLIVEEGYAAATSRRIAERAGLKHQLIFYYFASFDELLLEVLRRGAARDLDAIDAGFDPARPLRSMWKMARNPTSNRFLTEFMALANHNQAIRDELLIHAQRMRTSQESTFEEHLPAAAQAAAPPQAIAVLMAILSRGLALEDWMGLQAGHPEAEALIERFLLWLEQAPGAADI